MFWRHTMYEWVLSHQHFIARHTNLSSQQNSWTRSPVQQEYTDSAAASVRGSQLMDKHTAHIIYYQQIVSLNLDDTYPGILGVKIIQVHQNFDLDELTLGFSGPSQFIRTQLRTVGHLDTVIQNAVTAHKLPDKIRIIKGYCIRWHNECLHSFILC